MKHGLSIVLLLFTAGLSSTTAAQTADKSTVPATGGSYPLIKNYGRTWSLPDAAVQPQKGRIYRVIIDLSKAPPAPNQVLDGLEHAARLFNVFEAAGMPPSNVRAVAIFHGAAAYAAMTNDAYRHKFRVNNPNAELISELKAAGVEMLFCGQTLHDLNLSTNDLLPAMKLATSGAVVLITYQNDGYALLPF